MRILSQVKNTLIYECESDQELIKTIGDQMIALINSHDHCLIAMSPWNTPVPLFRYLTDNYNRNKTCYKHISFYMIDEIACDDKNSKLNFRSFMYKNFFDEINVKCKNIHSPIDYSEDHEYSRYDRAIWQANSIDLLVISIGEKGELNFVNHETNLNSLTHVVKINDDKTRCKFNTEFNYPHDALPEYIVTMGIRTILNANRIIAIARGKRKAEAIKKIMSGEVDDNYACTQLLNHRDVSIYIDEAAGSLLDK
ncbi:MAG: 6-phosphogluconolactonase [Mycoplasma sp.]